MEPLIIILSPRDIPEVKAAVDSLPYDRLWIKYYPAFEAYPLAEKMFNAPEARYKYTHMILIIDDLVVMPEQLQTLIEDMLLLPDMFQDMSVVAGYCNIDTRKYSVLSNVSLFDPPVMKPRTLDSYRFLTMSQIQSFKNISDSGKSNHPFNPYLFMTPMNGFACWVIPRTVKDLFHFRNDSPSGYDEMGCCWDVMSCDQLRQLKIPIFTDMRVKLQHLRYAEISITSKDLVDKNKYVFWESKGK